MGSNSIIAILYRYTFNNRYTIQMQQRQFHIFTLSIIISVIGISLAFFWGGLSGLFLIFILSILEVSLSFDNAVVNAKVLQKMTPVWQKRFLLWGILIAVFIIRLILPLFIVAVITGMGFIDVFKMALEDPSNYSKHLHKAHIPLSAFGGMFLFMVFLAFLFDSDRSIHWLGTIERKVGQLGRLKSIEIIMGLLVLLAAQSLIPADQAFQVLVPGVAGIILYVLIATITDFLEKQQNIIHTGFMGFLYLEILDASFSFDGVMSAFAITKDIVLITIGLAIGAIFVRSMTVFLVRCGTLNKYQYLEHGAHYAIGALAILMLMGIAIQIPEMLTGLIGVSFIMLSLASSIMYNRKVGR